MKALQRLHHLDRIFSHKRQLEPPQIHLLHISHNQRLKLNLVLLYKHQVNPPEAEQQDNEE